MGETMGSLHPVYHYGYRGAALDAGQATRNFHGDALPPCLRILADPWSGGPNMLQRSCGLTLTEFREELTLMNYARLSEWTFPTV